MSDHRDPVEAWLSSDVELLPPPPGTYQRVRRVARRRRAVRTMSAAAGAAVIVAAAAVLPQVAGNLLPGSPNPDRAGGGTSAQRHTGQRTSEPAVRPSPTSRTLPNGGLPIASAGSGPPAPDFRPTSVTFVGSHTGAVIGQAGSSCGGPCTAVAGTHDYGSTWAAIGAPPAGPPNGSAGVSQIRFLGLRNGWAYGPALYATHDGGHRWTAINGLPGRVIDLATVGHRAFAVVGARCSGTNYWENCARFSLFSTPASSDTWRPVSGASTTSQVVPGGLQLSSRHGYLVTNGLLYAGPVTGGAWHPVPISSPTSPPCLTHFSGPGPWLIAPNDTTLYLACAISRPNASPSSALSLYSSADHGQTWQAQGIVPVTGTATSLAVTQPGQLVLATTAGIYYSADGHSWRPAALDVPAPGSGGFSFVGMTDNNNGVAVPDGPGSRELYITTDGGQSWRHAPIR